ncbi:MAG: phenylacetate--CoA ligase family protein [Armatimonadota bacterium]
MTREYLEDETLAQDRIQNLQLKRLKEAVGRAQASEWYSEKLKQAGISPDTIESLDDVSKLPLTTKDDLRAGMPYKFLAVPLSEVVRMHYSSGTTGVATSVYHTDDDLRYWAECAARGLRAVGVSEEDVFQNMMGYGLFTGGLGLHYAAEMVGCMTIPAGAGNTQRQVEMLKRFNVTAIHVLPSYALRIIGYCWEHGIDPATDLSIRYAFVGAEPHSDMLRKRIEEGLGCRVYNCYGLSEMCGPGVAMECTEQNGLHLREDHYLAEILDPQTLEPVNPGERGELVLTTLRRQAMPLLRYRTRDITRMIPEQCPCGSEHSRIERILGRSDDMLIVKGVNIYPQQVEHVLMRTDEVGNNYVIVLESTEDLDEIIIRVELSQDVMSDNMRDLLAIEKRLVRALRSELLLTPQVELLQPNTLPPAEGKVVRVIDNREQR